MIIAAILASPHGIKGNTNVLASWLLYEAEQAGARIPSAAKSRLPRGGAEKLEIAREEE